MVALLQSRLPLELYRPIVELVNDRADLLRLTQVSTLLRAEAERLLYSAIELDPEHEPHFCEFFSQSATRLARHVRKCSLFLPGSKPTAEYFEEFARQRPVAPKVASRPRSARSVNVTTVIPMMNNLQTLSVSGHVAGVKFGKVLRGSQLCLRSFASTAPLDKTTLEFLESQPYITELTALHSRLSSALPGRTLSSKALPNLSIIRALTPRIACDLAPRRPVTHVETYVWGTESCAKVAARLALSRGPVRALLVIQGFKLRSRDIEDIAHHVPSMEYLGECHFADSISSCAKALAKFRALRTLVLSLQSVYAQSPDEDRVALVAQLARACPSLRTIVFTIALMPRQVWMRNLRTGKWEQHWRPEQTICCDLWASA
ncbi:hypothetical protein AURDEDRAFT_184085 [Auricularia subglabra TFB-10046 SS5]|nr:hypothetical protein AURDEDRAFT_184085 [Auricularia subglabra TFB-10046 SS5]